MNKIEQSFNDLGINIHDSNTDIRDGVKDALAFDVRRVSLYALLFNQAYFPLMPAGGEFAFESLARLESDKRSQLIDKSEDYIGAFEKIEGWFREGKNFRKRACLIKKLNIGDEGDLYDGIRARQ